MNEISISLILLSICHLLSCFSFMFQMFLEKISILLVIPRLFLLWDYRKNLGISRLLLKFRLKKDEEYILVEELKSRDLNLKEVNIWGNKYLLSEESVQILNKVSESPKRFLFVGKMRIMGHDILKIYSFSDLNKILIETKGNCLKICVAKEPLSLVNNDFRVNKDDAVLPILSIISSFNLVDEIKLRVLLLMIFYLFFSNIVKRSWRVFFKSFTTFFKIKLCALVDKKVWTSLLGFLIKVNENFSYCDEDGVRMIDCKEYPYFINLSGETSSFEEVEIKDKYPKCWNSVKVKSFKKLLSEKIEKLINLNNPPSYLIKVDGKLIEIYREWSRAMINHYPEYDEWWPSIMVKHGGLSYSLIKLESEEPNFRMVSIESTMKEFFNILNLMEYNDLGVFEPGYVYKSYCHKIKKSFIKSKNEKIYKISRKICLMGTDETDFGLVIHEILSSSQLFNKSNIWEILKYLSKTISYLKEIDYHKRTGLKDWVEFEKEFYDGLKYLLQKKKCKENKIGNSIWKKITYVISLKCSHKLFRITPRKLSKKDEENLSDKDLSSFKDEISRLQKLKNDKLNSGLKEMEKLISDVSEILVDERASHEKNPSKFKLRGNIIKETSKEVIEIEEEIEEMIVQYKESVSQIVDKTKELVEEVSVMKGKTSDEKKGSTREKEKEKEEEFNQCKVLLNDIDDLTQGKKSLDFEKLKGNHLTILSGVKPYFEDVVRKTSARTGALKSLEKIPEKERDNIINYSKRMLESKSRIEQRNARKTLEDYEKVEKGIQNYPETIKTKINNLSTIWTKIKSKTKRVNEVKVLRDNIITEIDITDKNDYELLMTLSEMAENEERADLKRAEYMGDFIRQVNDVNSTPVRKLTRNLKSFDPSAKYRYIKKSGNAEWVGEVASNMSSCNLEIDCDLLEMPYDDREKKKKKKKRKMTKCREISKINGKKALVCRIVNSKVKDLNKEENRKDFLEKLKTKKDVEFDKFIYESIKAAGFGEMIRYIKPYIFSSKEKINRSHLKLSKENEMKKEKLDSALKSLGFN